MEEMRLFCVCYSYVCEVYYWFCYAVNKDAVLKRFRVAGKHPAIIIGIYEV